MVTLFLIVWLWKEGRGDWTEATKPHLCEALDYEQSLNLRY